jgi:Pyruvate/2-oxoglutarate dehydrogenase complex, dihydrolipoamide acyltransferase (E2) component, and related enzymes
MSKKDLTLVISASPKVRKFARELGVDIQQVKGSQREGRVIEDDIKLFVSKKSIKNKEILSNNFEKAKLEYAHSEFGDIEIKDIPRVKKISSKYLVNSWTQIPHVTNHDEADITEMDEFRNSLTDIYTGQKKKITPLAFIVKALSSTLKKYPNFNSSIDEIDSGKMTLKNYCHIGIAVDTPNGLMVSKLRNADNKKISLIAEE